MGSQEEAETAPEPARKNCCFLKKLVFWFFISLFISTIVSKIVRKCHHDDDDDDESFFDENEEEEEGCDCEGEGCCAEDDCACACEDACEDEEGDECCGSEVGKKKKPVSQNGLINIFISCGKKKQIN